MAVAYLILVLVFTPAYIAAIRLGDQIVTRDGECVTGYSELAYFGVVTASTLGYGDITPGVDSVRARILVCIEVIQFWMFFALALTLVQKSADP